MSANTALQAPLDAQGFNVQNVVPQSNTDATTVTSSATDIKALGTTPTLGASLLAAPADHVHDLPVNMLQLQTNFRILLRSLVQFGLPLPAGLENEFTQSLAC